ncbi:MAG: S1 RNA-binding domain-containing protein [Polyangia bacterium]
MSEDDFEKMLGDSFAASADVAAGEKIEAEVIAVGSEWISLELGARSEGLLPREQVDRDGEPTVSPGDRLTVINTGMHDGAAICSLRVGAGAAGLAGGSEDAAAAVLDAMESEMPVEGRVEEVNKGGLSVSVMGLRGFCPLSQIELGYCESPESHLGRTHAFMVTRVEEGGRNVVLSRRRLLEREAAELASETWKELSEGDVREGVVTSLAPYGAFVDIGGLDGLIHVSELSHARVEDPSEVLAEGQRVTVRIKEIDREKERIALSLKSLQTDPWDETVAKLTSGSALRGRVTRLASFGAFVEIAPGVEGLVHVSRLAAGRRVATPREVVRQDEEIDVRVVEIDPERRRISLERIDEDAEAERKAAESFRQSARSERNGGSLGTLGDLLSDSLKKR